MRAAARRRFARSSGATSGSVTLSPRMLLMPVPPRDVTVKKVKGVKT